MGPKSKRRKDSSLSRSALILSPIVMWLLTAAILAVGLAALIAWKRRQERAVNEFSAQVWQLAREAGSAARIGLEDKTEALGRLGSAVNKLLENLEQRGARLLDREQLFQRLVETVHDAVLVHRERISIRQLALPGIAQPERPRGHRQTFDGLRRAGICRVGAEQSASAAGRAKRRPSVTRSS